MMEKCYFMIIRTHISCPNSIKWYNIRYKFMSTSWIRVFRICFHTRFTAAEFSGFRTMVRQLVGLQLRVVFMQSRRNKYEVIMLNESYANWISFVFYGPRANIRRDSNLHEQTSQYQRWVWLWHQMARPTSNFILFGNGTNHVHYRINKVFGSKAPSPAHCSVREPNSQMTAISQKTSHFTCRPRKHTR